MAEFEVVIRDLKSPYGLAFDPWDRLFIVDTYNHRVRVVAP